VKIPYSGTIDLLQQQKQDEDNWAADNKEPEYTLLTLDTATTTKVFDKVKTILGWVCGITGVPLMYVIRVALIRKEEKDDSPFGDKDTKYTSIDMESIARAPIFFDEADIYEENPENLEAYGLFVPPSQLTPRRSGPFF
jgi:hypothetical protein